MSVRLKVFSIIPVSFVDCRNDACSVFFLSGCNMRCIYCQNYPHYLRGKEISLKQIMDMLNKNWAVGMVKFTGGEPLLQAENLIEVCRRLKEQGYEFAIDTNGTKPNAVEELCKIGMREAAVDLKAPEHKYREITGINAYNEVLRTIRTLIDYNVDFEVRTTVVEPLITVHDLEEIAVILNKTGAKLWYIQVYRPVAHAKGLRRPDIIRLRGVINRLREEYSLDIRLRV
ncbi:MAG: anaerobic ribonucleoside-triphosphate reductase activating protein [Thermoprotei archaeon]|nr:MAG: anaerobic ribonucleoside-triphosphate reductase activating protein [Thermoprotei archaeon]